MFSVALIIFLIFSAVYLLFSSAIFYHLRQYTTPEQKAPRVIGSIFISLSCLFWFFAIYFLLQMAK